MQAEEFVNTVARAVGRLAGSESAGKVSVAVALSGGADSVALLQSLAAAESVCPPTSFRLTAALHCNFHLRGEESNADTLFCSELCRKLGIKLHTVDFNTAADRLSGESIEMACRRLRYQWFEQMTESHGFDFIAIAHHREDSEETVLLNMLRGSGPRGLSGIAAKRGRFIRPMLELTRNDIESYLAQTGLPYRTDSSNLSNNYRRNALRNDILPSIRRYFPDADSGIAATMKAMQSSTALIDNLLRIIANQAAVPLPELGATVLDVNTLNSLADDPATILYLLAPTLWNAELPPSVAADIISASKSKATGSRLFETHGNKRLELFDNRLFPFFEPTDSEATFSPLQISTAEFKDFETTISAGVISRREFEIELNTPSKSTAYFDAELLPATLTLRFRRSGDRIAPFGSSGTRKVSDIFSDARLSASRKNRQPLIAAGSEIIFIPGLCHSRSFSVAPSAERILRLSVQPSPTNNSVQPTSTNNC